MKHLFSLPLLAFTACLTAGEFSVDVPMQLKDAHTYYISGQVGEITPSDFMVDTGSSYMMINEITLAQLKQSGEARYRRELTGILANGDEMRVPIYTLPKVRIGENCVLEDVEAAVFPGDTRQILGLSALLKAAPFIFSTEPPKLQLSHCLVTAESGSQT
ncbi:MAG: retropepsin-like aspartic protease [Gammaproteobacteria bacterium]|nr:retropepsin-like aspartic protease [Gammaproteobacteria bacterium]